MSTEDMPAVNSTVFLVAARRGTGQDVSIGFSDALLHPLRTPKMAEHGTTAPDALESVFEGQRAWVGASAPLSRVHGRGVGPRIGHRD